MTDVMIDVLFFVILDNGPAGICRAVFVYGGEANLTDGVKSGVNIS